MSIREMLEDKVNEIFVEEQTKRGITSGDVDPWDSIKLDQMLDLVANRIEAILKFQEPKEIQNFDDMADIIVDQVWTNGESEGFGVAKLTVGWSDVEYWVEDTIDDEMKSGIIEALFKHSLVDAVDVDEEFDEFDVYIYRDDVRL